MEQKYVLVKHLVRTTHVAVERQGQAVVIFVNAETATTKKT